MTLRELSNHLVRRGHSKVDYATLRAMAAAGALPGAERRGSRWSVDVGALPRIDSMFDGAV